MSHSMCFWECILLRYHYGHVLCTINITIHIVALLHNYFIEKDIRAESLYFTVKHNEHNWCCLLGRQRRNADGMKKRTYLHHAGRYNKVSENEQKAFRSIRKMQSTWYSKDKLKVIGAFLPSHSVFMKATPCYNYWVCWKMFISSDCPTPLVLCMGCCKDIWYNITEVKAP